MIYVETASRSPYFNFAVEEYFMTEKPQSDTVFLFWQTEPTVMLGKFQNSYKELNLANIEADQVNVVRRQTGGGTIYTDRGGWQFSFILPEKSEQINFGQFMDPIIAALADLGIQAEYNSRNDLVIEGRKISGNAQCSRGNFTLHHGSLLYATDFSKMASYLNVPEHKLKSKGINSVRSRTANIQSFCPEQWHSEEFAERMIAAILANGAEKRQLTTADIEACEKIANEKFRSWEWTYGKNPAFTMIRSRVFTGGLLEISLEVKAGKISACSFQGDFFSAKGVEELVEELIGTPYQKAALENVILQNKYENLIHKITPLEILSCFFDD